MQAEVTKLSLPRCQKAALAGLLLLGLALNAWTASAQGVNIGRLNSENTPQPQFLGTDASALASHNPIQLESTSIAWENDQPFMTKRPQSDLSLVIRYNHIFEGDLIVSEGKSTVPDGWYAVTAVVLLADREEVDTPTDPRTRYVTSVHTYTKVRNGHFSGLQIGFDYYSAPPTAMLDNLLIEFIPLQEKCFDQPHVRPGRKTTSRACISTNEDGEAEVTHTRLHLKFGYRPFMASMPFIPFKEKDSYHPLANKVKGQKNPIKGETLERFAWEQKNAQKEARLNRLSGLQTPEQYASEHNLKLIRLNSPELITAGAHYLPSRTKIADRVQQILTFPTVGTLRLNDADHFMMPALCEILSNLNGLNSTLLQLDRCKTDPAHQLHLTRITHVKKLDPQTPVKRLFNPPITLGESANGIRTRSSTVDTSRSMSIQPLGPFFKAIEFLTLGMISYTISGSVSNGHGDIDQGVMSLGVNNVFMPLGLQMNTVNSIACLQVIPHSRKPLRGLYICSDVMPNLTIREVYAHVFNSGVSGSYGQAYERGTQTINRDLRGDLEMSALFWKMREGLTAYHDFQTDSFPSSWTESAETYFSSSPMSFPGLNVVPVVFGTDSVPSVIDSWVPTFREHFISDEKHPANY